MSCISDYNIGEEIQVETGYTNWDRSDNDFYCILAGYDEEGRAILDAKNSVCFDGRNSIRPYFVVDRNTVVGEGPGYKKIPGCYVLWHITGMDDHGRFILRTQTRNR